MTTSEHHHLHERVMELLPAYALGAADEAEVRLVEEHLPECEECRRELATWRRSTEALAASVPAVTPSAAVRESLMETVEAEAPARRTADGGGAAPVTTGTATPASSGRGGGSSILRWAAMIALALVAVAALYWGLSVQDRMEGEVERLEAEVAGLENELRAADAERAQADSELRSAQAVLALLAGSQPSRDVVLAGLEAAPNSQGRLIVDARGRRAVFLAGQLPPLEAGRVYQLWSLKDGQPASAGVFETVAGGTAIHVVEDVPETTPDAWAVTIEPEGGVPAPTGPMVLMG